MTWTEEEIRETVKAQRAFFRTDATLDVAWRKQQLKRLKQAVLAHQFDIVAALQEDLGRSETEAFFCDVGDVILEINEAIAGVRKWARPETHYSGLVCFPSVLTRVNKMPYGASLIKWAGFATSGDGLLFLPDSFALRAMQQAVSRPRPSPNLDYDYAEQVGSASKKPRQGSGRDDGFSRSACANTQRQRFDPGRAG